MSAARTYLDYLDDILGAIDDCSAFIQGMDEAAFRADRRTVYAVTRALEIIGEATKRIPPDIQARYPDVPWRFMARMRDRIIHGYDTVDSAIVWQTLTIDIPPTRSLIQNAVAQERRASQP
jgi:uncharacterized protein with HEPN domain